MTTIHDLTAHAQSCAYATNELSPVEVTRAALARIEAWEKTINAMYVVDRDGRAGPGHSIRGTVVPRARTSSCRLATSKDGAAEASSYS